MERREGVQVVNRFGRVAASVLLGAALFSPFVSRAMSQAVTPVPKLDLEKLTGTWFVIARLPVKSQKSCVSDVKVLYALGDKPRSFRIVTSCQIKNGNPQGWTGSGKMDKAGDGKLKVGSIWPFTAKDWVLATGPAFEWALVGSPNHKVLWILSRTTTVAPELLAEIEAKAAAQGFNTAKLVTLPQGH